MTDSEKLNLILDKVNNLDEKVDNLDEKVSDLDGKVSDLGGKVSSLESDLQEVKHKVTKTELIIENEIRVNIQRVAEGHLDLSRQVNECIKLAGEIKAKQVIQDIYINMHDSKLKAL